MSLVHASERLVAQPKDESPLAPRPRTSSSSTSSACATERRKRSPASTFASRAERSSPSSARTEPAKTTTVEILEGFRQRTDGTVSVLGLDPSDGDREWRNRIGAVLQESSAEPGLTVRECLELYADEPFAPRGATDPLAA